MHIRVEVAPYDDLVDVERHIVVDGLKPESRVTLASRVVRADGKCWEAEAVFVADREGVVDLRRDAPASGSYDCVSAMGLVWSQVPRCDAPAGAPVPASEVAPLTVEIIASDAGGGEARASFIQRHLDAGVTRRAVQEAGVSGVLYLPAGDGPFPAVMVLNGSGGGVNEPRAALYASRGYAALALGFFNAPGRPKYINDTPLEYFRDAIRWMRQTLAPKDGFVAITGQSRGGELVLLVAATFPEDVSAVMAYVPAAYVHSAQSAADPAKGRESATWTLGGKPLPHLWEDNRTGTWRPYDDGPQPRRHEYALLTALADRRAAARARIPVEKIDCPVMLVHGTDDGWWPTDYHCDVVEETLADSGFAHPFRRLRFVGAGHAILFPYVPTTEIERRHPMSGVLATSGGQPHANAVANEQTWPGVLGFLQEAIAHEAARERTFP